MANKVIFNFLGTSSGLGALQLERDYITSATLKEVYYNNLSSADNSFSFKVPFDSDLADALKARINDTNEVIVLSDSGIVFTGFLRPSSTFTKTQRNQPISLEAVTGGYLLDFTFSENYTYEGKTISEIVTALMSLASTVLGYTFSIDLSNISDNKTVLIAFFQNGENFEKRLENFLRSFGYTYNFDSDGVFVVVPLFDSPSTITQTFTGENCLTKIQQSVKETTTSKVEINWKAVKFFSSALIFSDTQGATGDKKCSITLAAGEYFADDDPDEPDAEKTVYCEYDSAYGKVLCCTALTNMAIIYNDASSVSQTVQNYETKAGVIIHNEADAEREITQFDLYGNAYISTAENVSVTGDDSGNTTSYDADFIYTTTEADELAKEFKDWHSYSTFEITLSSKDDFDLGSFVSVSDTGIGLINGRITQKSTNLQTGIIDYTITAIDDYTPASAVDTQKNIKGKNQGLIESIFQNQRELNDVLGYKIELSPDYTTISVDSEGEPLSGQNDIEITAELYHGAEKIESGVVKSVLLNGSAVSLWTSDDTISVSPRLLTQETNSIEFVFVYSLRTIRKTMTIAKLYQSDLVFYDFSVSDTVVKKLDSTYTPPTVTAKKFARIESGIIPTEYGRLTYSINEGAETDIEFAQVEESATFDDSETYYQSVTPFLLSLGGDDVLAISEDVAAVFFGRS